MWCKLLAGAGLLLCGVAATAAADGPPKPAPAALQEAELLNRLPPIQPAGKPAIDRSGRAEKGRASYYAKHFDNRTMADGRPMNPNANIAASKTLPLGTTAKVTNLDNGRTVTVKVEDRGPYVKGRVVDVTPKVASELGMRRQGIAPVVVKPITVPLQDGAVKLGAGAATETPQQIQEAAQATESVVGTKTQAVAATKPRAVVATGTEAGDTKATETATR